MSDLKPFLKVFLEQPFTPGSYHAALQRFLRTRWRKGLSPYSLIHLFNSLMPLGEALHNPPVAAVTPHEIKEYVDSLYLKYVPGTIKPIIGDIKQFFNWCKKKKLITKLPTKRLKIRRKRRIARKQKAASETAVFAVLSLLVTKLKPMIYRDLFGNLQIEPAENWTIETITAARDLFVLSFLYETGCRASELTGLGARVMERETAVAKSAYTVTAIGKTNDRDLRFTQVTAELWHVWHTVQPHKESAYVVYGLRPTHGSYAALTSNAVSLILVRRCKEARVTVFRSHALRHAKVTRSTKLVGIEMASVLVDHSSVETTRGYDESQIRELDTAVVVTGIQGDLWQNQTNETGAESEPKV